MPIAVYAKRIRLIFAYRALLVQSPDYALWLWHELRLAVLEHKHKGNR